MKTKLLRLCLTALMMLMTTTSYAYNAYVDGIYYYFDDSTATVTSGIQYYSGEIIIPSTVVYKGRTYSVTNIGSNAFSGCSSLTSVNIPESVTTIQYGAFSGCSSLTSVNIPESVTTIQYDAFFGCSSLTSVNIPESVTTIESETFRGCSSLTSVNIPESVTTIQYRAFSDCSSLTSVNIPESVTTIRYGAFSGCSSLTSVNIPESVTAIEKSTFGHCTALTSVNIPESVTYIGEYAFYNCSSLTSVNIPESVTYIGYVAFGGCTALTSVNIPASLPYIKDNAFGGCTALSVINITDLEAWCKNSYDCFGAHHLLLNDHEIKDLVIPNSVTSIEKRAFKNCTFFTSITIPSSITAIGDNAFDGCRNLEAVYCHLRRSPEMGKDVFSNIDLAFSALYVPDESLNGYSKTAPWSEFGTILPLSKVPEAIQKVYTLPSTNVSYDLNGRKLNNASTGISIIRQSNGNTRKVIAK